MSPPRLTQFEIGSSRRTRERWNLFCKDFFGWIDGADVNGSVVRCHWGGRGREDSSIGASVTAVRRRRLGSSPAAAGVAPRTPNCAIRISSTQFKLASRGHDPSWTPNGTCGRSEERSKRAPHLPSQSQFRGCEVKTQQTLKNQA